MKIKTISIKNFKNFIGSHEFNLKDINILYAENGFGKSSFFDAIEWCITGEIARFKDFDENDIINHNIKDKEFECEVSILFEYGKLTRTFNVRNLKKCSNRSVYIEYTDSNGEVKRESGEKNISKLIHNNSYKGLNLINKVKQNHILSQDQVTDFINKENPKVRYKTLLAIMGIQNSTITVENFKKINKQLEIKLKEIEDIIKRNKEEIYTINKYKEKVSEELSEKISIIDNTLNNSSYEDFLKKYNEEELLKSIKNEINKNIKYKQIYIRIKELGLLDIQSVEKNYKETKSLVEKSIDQRDQLIKNQNNLKEKLKKLEKVKSENDRINELKSELKKYTIELQSYDINENDVKLYQSLKKKLKQINYSIENKRKLNVFIENKLKLEKRISELEKNIKENKLNYDKYKLDLDNVQISIKNTDTKELINLVDNLKNIKSYVENTNSKACPVCNTRLESSLLSSIENNIEKMKLRCEYINSENKSLIENKFKLVKDLEELEKLISIQSEELKKIKNNRRVILEEMNIITEDILYNKEIFEERLDILSSTKQNIELRIIKIEKYLTTQENIEKVKSSFEDKSDLLYEDIIDNDDIETQINLLQKTIYEIDNNKKDLEQKYDEYRSLQYKYKDILESIDNDINIYINQNIEIAIGEINQKIEKLNEESKLVQYVYQELDKFKRNNLKEIEINKIKDLNKKQERLCSLLSEKISNNSDYIDSIFKYSGDYIDECLNKDDSIIKKYYRFLNPMPSEQDLYFESEEDSLHIKLKYRDKDIIRFANKTLSSGQLNVLALSIFLSMNENQNIDNLDLIAIDDPIQNMDDVNRFSICDILGGIEKQMIFSTHDIEFVKLFIKKNTKRAEKIKIFNFKSPYLTPDKVRTIDLD